MSLYKMCEQYTICCCTFLVRPTLCCSRCFLGPMPESWRMCEQYTICYCTFLVRPTLCCSRCFLGPMPESWRMCEQYTICYCTFLVRPTLCCSRCFLGPMPESWRMCGDPTTPADRITSCVTFTRWRVRFRINSTPIIFFPFTTSCRNKKSEYTELFNITRIYILSFKRQVS